MQGVLKQLATVTSALKRPAGFRRQRVSARYSINDMTS
jgi:hypothetical protein